MLAWETTVTGTSEDGDPVEDLVYVDARTGDQLGREAQVQHASGTGYAQYSGTVTLQTTPSGSTYQLNDGTRGGHLTYDANNSTSTARGTLLHRRRQRLGQRHLREPADRRGRRRLRRGRHLGPLQGLLRPQRHPRRRGRGLLARPLRQRLRERLLGRLLLLHDVRRRRLDPQRADVPRRGRPRDVARADLVDGGPGLLRRRRRPQRVHVRRDGHDGGVQGRERQRPGRLLHRREDLQDRRRLPAPDGQPGGRRRLGELLDLVDEEPRPALLLRRRQPRLLPDGRGHRGQDHRRAARTRAAPATAPR